VYDASGQRVRKITERQADAGQTPTRRKERIYLGGFEIYREYNSDGTTVSLERETLHIMDDQQRIALVETRTQGNDDSPLQLIRYQLGNHLGSASLELSDQGAIVSYEEYYPYGSTSYQGGRSVAEVGLKRYRYTGKERDGETGLYYHGARYYAAWLGRWVSADPAGLVDGTNRYNYVSGRPSILRDGDGREGEPLWLMEQGHLTISPVATRTHRGITALQRSAIRGLSFGFGPGTDFHWAHPDDQPFVTQRAGTRVRLTPEPGGPNMSKQNASKVAAEAAEEAGEFRRVWDPVGEHSVDETVLKGTRFKQPPPEPFEKPFADYIKAIDNKKLPETLTPAEAYKQSVLPDTDKVLTGKGEQLSLTFDKQPVAPSVDPTTVADTPPITSGKGTQALAPLGKGTQALKIVAEGAEVLGVVATLGIEGENEGSSAEAIVKLAAGAGALKLGARALATPGGQLVGSALIGLGIGYVAEKELNVSDYSSASGKAAQTAALKLGASMNVATGVGVVATISATVPALGEAAIRKVGSWLRR
jgi:RHS repeat-associated protein